MVYYLDNGDKFLLAYTAGEIVFVLYSTVKKAPMITQTRWYNVSVLSDHMQVIINYLQSSDEGNTKIGKGILEESLKVVINGNIVGFREE